MDTLPEFLSAAPADLRDAVVAWATKHKVTRASLVPYCFSTNDAFAQAVGLEPSATAELWRALGHHKDAWQDFQAREDDRMRAVQPPPGVRSPSFPAKAPGPWQPRSTPPTAGVKRPQAAASAAEAKASTKVCQPRPPATADQVVIDHLWNLLRALGPDGSFHNDLESCAAHLADYKTLWSARFETCSAEGMRSRWATWKTWDTWCQDQSADPLAPDAGLLAGWLMKAKSRGPTVAPQAYYAFLWVAKHIGLALPTSSLLDPLKRVSATHQITQVMAYPLRVLAHFDILSRSPNAFIAHAAAGCRLRCMSSLRPMHVQRSSIIRSTDRCVLGLCAMGKTPKDGARRPFLWVCSRQSLEAPPGKDDFPAPLLAPQRLFPDVQSSWLIWEWGPAKADISEATEWLPTPCKRLRKLEQGLLQMPPLSMDPGDANQFQARSARRAVATAAGRLRLSQAEICALGNWVDTLPTGESTQDASRALGTSMPVRYDQARLVASARAADKIALGLRLTAMSAGSFDLDWDGMDDHLPNISALDMAVSDAGKGLLTILEGEGPRVPLLGLRPQVGPSPPKRARNALDTHFPSPPKPADAPGGAKTPSASGSEDSDGDSSSDPEAGEQATPGDHPLYKFHDLRWCKARAKTGLLHICVDWEGALPRMACGITLRDVQPGEGLSTALATGATWHRSCLDRSDPALAEFLTEWDTT